MKESVQMPVCSPSHSDNQLEVFGRRGGSIELPVESTEVTNIIWKHGKNKAAEWFMEDNQPTYFSQFENSTVLNNETWSLKISDLQPHHNGIYSAEVNNKDPTKTFKLTVLSKLIIMTPKN